MGKIVCSCQKEFDSKFEYELHLSHNRNHRPAPSTSAKETPSVAKVEEVEKVENEPEINEEPPYSLAASREGLGELAPVLKDANGEIIDGFHRLGENANWHSITVPSIDTPVKLELARLAVNFNRRKVSSEELTQRITFLIKAGLKPDEIAKLTGINQRTVYKHMPQQFKNPIKIEAGQTRQKANSLDAPGHQTVKSSDSLGSVTSFTPKTAAQQTEPEEPEVIPPEPKDESEHDQLVRLQERVTIFSEYLEQWKKEVVGDYDEEPVADRVTKKFDDVFGKKLSAEP